MQKGVGKTVKNSYPDPLYMQNAVSSYYNVAVLKDGHVCRQQEAEQRPSGSWVKKLEFSEAAFHRPPGRSVPHFPGLGGNRN